MTDPTRETGTTLDPKWDDRGLIQAVTTDAATGEVLMVAHMNAAALAATLATGEAHYWSRSRGEVWHKGATSGEHAGGRRTAHRLRPGCDLAARHPGGPRVPHRGALVLLSGGGGGWVARKMTGAS